MVLFESGMEHEVLPAYAKRFAVTAWFSEKGQKVAPSLGGVCSIEEAEAERSPHTDAYETPFVGNRGNLSMGPKEGAGEIAESPHLKTSFQTPASTGKQSVPSSSPCKPDPHLDPPSTSQPNSERIFVSIACFRDSECRWTVKDLFQKADVPGRVWVGIVWQIDEQEDGEFAHLRGLNAAARERVREVRVDWRTATGPCLARHQAQQLWDGEEFFLQVRGGYGVLRCLFGGISSVSCLCYERDKRIGTSESASSITTCGDLRLYSSRYVQAPLSGVSGPTPLGRRLFCKGQTDQKVARASPVQCSSSGRFP